MKQQTQELLSQNNRVIGRVVTGFLLIIFLVLTWYQFLFLQIRIPRDSGAFLTIASGLFHGSLPYADLVDHKPPGIYYTLAAALAIDHSVYAARTLLYVTNAGTAILLVLAGRRASSLRTGLLAACIYLAGLTIYQGLWLLTEPFVAFWSVAALLTATYATSRYNSTLYVLVGVVTGIGCLYKQTGILIAIGVIGYFVMLRVDWRHIGLFLLGIASVGVFTFVYFASQNALNSLVYWTVLANQSYTPTTLMTTLETIHLRLDSAPVLWGAAVGGLASSLRRWRNSTRILASMFFVLALGPLLIRQYGHYFIQPLPFAALLAAVFLDDLAEVVATKGPELIPSPWPWISIFTVFLVLTAPTINGVVNAHHRVDGFSLDDQQSIAGDVASYSQSDDPLLVVTAEPQYYFLADRQPLGRNVYYIPINRGISFTPTAVVERIDTQRPAVVLLRGCERSPIICTYVKQHYQKQGSYKRGITIWSLN